MHSLIIVGSNRPTLYINPEHQVFDHGEDQQHETDDKTSEFERMLQLVVSITTSSKQEAQL